MSWTISVKGAGRAETFARFKEEAEKYARPAAEAARIVGYAEAITAGMPDETVNGLSSYGHLNENGSGNASVSVNTN